MTPTASRIGWSFLLAAAIGAREVLSWKEAYSHIEYSTVTGFFLQDEPLQPDDFGYAPHNFGLIERSYSTDHDTPDSPVAGTQWQRFERHVNSLNAEADDDTTYKVLFLGRHGQGYHNAAEDFYGTPAWDCYWAQQDGNGTSTWSDAELTATGAAQGQRAASFWASQVAHEGTPAPGSYYSSPLTRCLQTALATFGSLASPPPPTIKVKEFLREGLCPHTCDRRSARSHLDRVFPGVLDFEPAFAELDPLWSATAVEPRSAEVARTRLSLDEIFTEDDQTWVSITAHYGTISCLLDVLGHCPTILNPGQAIPVLVKARRVYHAYPAPVAAWTSPVLCREPPVTSLPARGCVCSDHPSPTATARLPNPDRLGDLADKAIDDDLAEPQQIIRRCEL